MADRRLRPPRDVDEIARADLSGAGGRDHRQQAQADRVRQGTEGTGEQRGVGLVEEVAAHRATAGDRVHGQASSHRTTVSKPVDARHRRCSPCSSDATGIAPAPLSSAALRSLRWASIVPPSSTPAATPTRGWRSGTVRDRVPGDPGRRAPRRRRRAVDAPTASPTSRRGTPLTTEHRFRIASHSKTFTATAVVQLAEQGRLRLDDTVGHWLADLAGDAARRRHAARAARPRRRRRPRRLGRRPLAARPAVPRRADAAPHRRRRRRRARPQRALQVLQHRLLAARRRSSRRSPAGPTPTT